MFLELLKGAALLCALCYLQNLKFIFQRRGGAGSLLFAGIFYALIAIVGMLTGFQYAPGIVYDARSVVLSMAGLFGGAYVAGIAFIGAALCRYELGGVGTQLGIIMMALSAGAGLFYRWALQRAWVSLSLLHLFGFGLLLHVLLIGLFGFYPGNLPQQVYRDVAPFYVLALVPATVLLGRLLHDVEKRHDMAHALRESEARMRATGRALPDPLFILNEDGYYLVSSRFCDASAQMRMQRGPHVREVLAEAAAQTLCDVIRLTLQGQAPASFTYELFQDGEQHVFEARVQLMDELIAGKRALVFLARDVTEREKTQQALRQSEQRLHSFFELGQVGMAICMADTRWISVNDYLCRLLEYSHDELMSMSWRDLSYDGDLEADLREYKRMLAGEIDSFEMEKRYVTASGRIVPTQLFVRCVRKADRSVDYVTAIILDISLRKQAEAARHESELRYRLAFETSPDAISISRMSDGCYIDVNAGFERLSGWSRNEIIGRTATELGLWNDLQDRERLLTQMHLVGRCESLELHFLARNKNIVTVLLSAHVIELGGEQCLLAISRDISYRKANEEAIRRLALFDPLTQLPNRRLLLDRLQQAIRHCEQASYAGALLIIDLDDFKNLNDTLGHQQGDLLLQRVAERLSLRLRESDTLTRLGGDEFVLIVEGLSPVLLEAETQARRVADKLLAALAEAFELDGSAYSCSASIGVAVFDYQGSSCDELMRRADLAMYQAKAAGRGMVRFFDPRMQEDINARVALESGLREALSAEQFVLFYQPQVDAQGLITGAEVLVRWQHPIKGLITPNSFIPMAEESNLILPLGHWILQVACMRLAAWASDPRYRHLTLAVNVSARQCRQPNFVDEVLAVIAATGADPQKLKLELTESMLVDDIESTIAKMEQLEAAGVRFSLDDFGTGYSSLGYLKRLPLAQLKIDRSFVRDVLTDPNDASIARTIVALAHSLGLEVIAEGVESSAQHAFLIEHGCHHFQGYLFGRPMPVEDFEQQLAAQHPPQAG